LELSGVSAGYERKRRVLRDVTFSVSAGENVALIGANGAGKSTTLFVCCGIIAPETGSVSFDSQTLDERARKSLWRRAGIVFQNPDDQLFMPTVAQDAAFGPEKLGLAPREAAVAAKEWLERLGIAGLSERNPARLSGGEKRLAALAGVLAMNPELIFFDEPCAFLDPKARRLLIAALRSVPTAKIIATHDFDLASRLCERTVLLSEGRVAADGLTPEVLGDAGLLESAGL
jgi:cobalt/nickel transport system ATP-binding protein